MANRSLASSAAAMASGTLVSRILGLVRGAMLAASIATVGGAANAFSVANKLPTIIYMLIAGGVINAVLVPQIVRAMRQADGGTRYVNQLLTFASLVLGGLTIVLTAGASVLLTLYAAKMSAEWQPIALAFAYICLPQLFFYGLYTLFGQVLNARGNFGPYMWAPALNNVVSIIGLGVYLALYGEYQVDAVTAADWDATRIWLVAGTATVGIAAQALVLIIPLRRIGFRYRPVFGLRGSGLGRASRVAGWAFAALAVGQLGYLAISNLAIAADTAGAELGITVAANAAYDHAFTIFMLPQSLITVSLVTALFTRMSQHAAAGSVGRVRESLSMGLRTLAVFTVFATAAIMVLAIPVVAVILAGRPSWEAQQAIGHVVVAFSIGLVPIGVWTMVQRVYYAYEDTRNLFYIQIPMMLIVAVSCGLAYVILPPNWWVVGAAVGTTLSNSMGAIVAYLGLRRKLPSLDGARVLHTHVRVTAAVLPPTLIGWGLLHVWGVQAGLLGSLARVLVIGTLMGLGYLMLLRVFNVSELDALMDRVLRILSPLTRRLSPVVARLPGSHHLRKIGTFFSSRDTAKVGVVGETLPWQAGQLIVDRYRLISSNEPRSGNGYSLTSWVAKDEILDKIVRVEELEAESERLDAALDAARRSALLTDAFFPKIYRITSDGDRGVIVSQFIDGQAVGDLINTSSLEASGVRAIVGEAAIALERARKQGIHHLVLGPNSLVVDNGNVFVMNIGYEAALAGVTAQSSDLAARQDTVGLAQILFAGLSGTWLGPSSRGAGLPSGPQSVTSAHGLHERAPEAPIDLVRLSHLTMGPFEDGPHTPGELEANLRPWAEVPQVLQPVSVMAEDFHTGEFAVVPAPTTPSADITPADSTSPILDLTGDDSTSEDEESPVEVTDPPTISPSQDQPPLTEGLTGADSSTTFRRRAEPLNWDVPSETRPATVQRTKVTSPVLTASGETTFFPAPDKDFPSVVTGENELEPRTPGDVPSGGAQRRARTGRLSIASRVKQFTGEVMDQFKPVDEEERTFNPAGFVLLAMAAVVVFAIVLATSSLREASQFDSSALPERTPVTATPTPSEPDSPITEPDDPSPSETPTSTTIVIDEAISYDPSTGGGENQDLAHRAIDEDPNTYWRSLRYNSPTYAIKAGLGFSVVLESPAEVSEVVLNVHGKGGKVEIRDGKPEDPTEGSVLASGPLDGETTFALSEPIETDTIVLWFPELPVADSDGMNRIELAEVIVK